MAYLIPVLREIEVSAVAIPSRLHMGQDSSNHLTTILRYPTYIKNSVTDDDI